MIYPKIPLLFIIMPELVDFYSIVIEMDDLNKILETYKNKPIPKKLTARINKTSKLYKKTIDIALKLYGDHENLQFSLDILCARVGKS